MLSSYPDYLLITKANKLEWSLEHWQGNLELASFDHELDLRKPDEAAYYFGDCDGQAIFIPAELEYDGEGQPIASEMVGYSEEGEEAWNLMQSQ